MWPAWDASGKYLWFLASTDFGLRSQWLDMTSYDREETFGLYFAVLKKGEPSPLLPESDEDPGVGSAAPGCWRRPRWTRIGARRRQDSGEASRGSERRATSRARAARAGHRADRFRRPAAAHHLGAGRAGAPVLASCKAGAAGTVYYLEAAAGGGRGGAGGGATLHRYRLSDRRAAPFVTGVADYDVSADGRKLLYRTGGGGGGRGRRRRRRRASGDPVCSSSTPIAIRRQPVRDGST